MIAKTRAFPNAKLILVVALLGCASLLAPASSIAAKTAGKAAVLIPESLSAFEGQLDSSQVTATVFNVKGRDVHVTLANGKHMLVHYGSGDETTMLKLVEAKGLTPVNGKGVRVKPPKARKHKIRYIAGAVVIVLIVIVVAILLIRRKRAAADDY
ncbi:MAG TPA: hypothetical protein VMD79_05360 [Solirubrobacteraceae bacterium]|nr:hypothetical protein [Solirubrobacteraceae bacterium]